MTDLLPISELFDSFEVHLLAEGRSPKTIDSYKLALDQLIKYVTDEGLPTEADKIEKKHVQLYLADFRNTHASATVRQRYSSLKQFFKWAHEENEIPIDPVATIKPPKVVEQSVPVLTIEEIRALHASCKREGREGDQYVASRDEAIIRLLLDTGIRLGELIGLESDDVDRKTRVVHVLGKGSRFRSVPFDVKTSKALDTYWRRRRSHPEAGRKQFWLGRKGPLTNSGVAQMLKRRSADASIPKVHAHQFRHTFAHQWLSVGGNEGDLQRIAGWASPQMLQRYGASAADQRAQEAYRRLGLWDDL